MISSQFTKPIVVSRQAAGSSIVLSTDLIAANDFKIVVNDVLVSVVYSVSALNTMALIAAAIAAVGGVTSAIAASSTRIDILPSEVGLEKAVVTGGASQPTVSLYGGYFGGTYIPGIPSSISMQASVQPLRGYELLNVVEAQRGREQFKVYSDLPLLSLDEANGVLADRFTFAGHTYEVHSSAPNLYLGRPHYKCMASRLDPAPH